LVLEQHRQSSLDHNPAFTIVATLVLQTLGAMAFFCTSMNLKQNLGEWFSQIPSTPSSLSKNRRGCPKKCTLRSSDDYTSLKARFKSKTFLLTNLKNLVLLVLRVFSFLFSPSHFQSLCSSLAIIRFLHAFFFFRFFHVMGKFLHVADFVSLSSEVNDTTKRVHHLSILRYLEEVLLRFPPKIF